MSARNDALEEAAQLVERGAIPEPLGEEEEHVNYVLKTLARDIRQLKS